MRAHGQRQSVTLGRLAALSAVLPLSPRRHAG
jgi:hypothetical protein